MNTKDFDGFSFVSTQKQCLGAPKWLLTPFFLVTGRITDPISATPRDCMADFTETESSYSRCSPCWSTEQLPPPQLHCTQVCLCSSSELPMPFSNSLSHSPFHANISNNNGRTFYSHQRRGAGAKVTGKKSRGMYACSKAHYLCTFRSYHHI